MESIRIGGLYDGDTKHQAGSVWDKNKLAPTIDTMQGGYREPMIIDEVNELVFMDNGTQQIKVLTENIPCTTSRVVNRKFADVDYLSLININKTESGAVVSRYYKGIEGDHSDAVIVATRGMNPENPSDRTVGAQTEQRLEPNSQGICNTLTSVQKDNLVMETKVINPLKGLSDNGWHFEQNVYDSDGIVRSVKAGGGSGNIPKVIETQYRIRKLTPRECYRLMAVPEKDIDKMLEVNSNTQCYKQAGNSIVVNCLIAIFSQMGIQGIPRWNDGLSEKYK